MFSCPCEELRRLIDFIPGPHKHRWRRPLVQQESCTVHLPGTARYTETAGVVPEILLRDAPQPQTELLPLAVTVVNPARLEDGSSVSEPGDLKHLGVRLVSSHSFLPGFSPALSHLCVYKLCRSEPARPPEQLRSTNGRGTVGGNLNRS